MPIDLIGFKVVWECDTCGRKISRAGDKKPLHLPSGWTIRAKAFGNVEFCSEACEKKWLDKRQETYVAGEGKL